MRPRSYQKHPARPLWLPRVLLERSGGGFEGLWEPPGATLEAPGLLWGAFGSHVGRFLGIFWGSEAGSGAERTQK